MKKILASAVVALASLAGYAQTYVAGSFGVSYNSTTEKTQFTLVPEIGHDINEKFAVGGTIGYTYNKSFEIDGVTKEVKNYVQLNPYFRYTFARVADGKLGFFFDTTAGVGIGFQDGETGVTYEVGFKPGMKYSISDHCTLVAHLGFLGWQGASDKAKMFGFQEKFSCDFTSLNLSFGLSYSF